MKRYCCLAFSCLFVATLSQRYKKIYIITDDELKRQNISPETNQLIYEIKSCTRSSLKFASKYMIHKMPHSGNLVRVTFKNLETHEILAEQIFQNLLSCDEFLLFKFGLINGNLTLWTTKTTGWDVLLTTEDPFPGTSISHVTLFGRPAEWKIYQIEHTSQPYKAMCFEN